MHIVVRIVGELPPMLRISWQRESPALDTALARGSSALWVAVSRNSGVRLFLLHWGRRGEEAAGGIDACGAGSEAERCAA